MLHFRHCWKELGEDEALPGEHQEERTQQQEVLRQQEEELEAQVGRAIRPF
jgi:hypothetical protein